MHPGSSNMPFSGEELVKALSRQGFQPYDQTGSHVHLEYTHPDTGERRVVTVPLHDEVDPNTLRSIAKQAGAKDFKKFKKWIEELI